MALQRSHKLAEKASLMGLDKRRIRAIRLKLRDHGRQTIFITLSAK
jgi:hypothetical protein